MSERVIIFGNSGSGKSTLARQLSEQHQLAHLDLDTLAWQPTDPPLRRDLPDALQAVQAFISQHPRWVIEGCYADLLEPILTQASQVIYMDLPVSLCQANAKNRPWEPHKYASQADQDNKLPMLLSWIADYDQRNDVFSRRAHEALYAAFKGDKSRIQENPV
jgi:adenylate kinase family enzyme